MGMNAVTISGNLTRDAEYRLSQSGTPMVRFGIAHNEWRKNGDKVHFFDCTMFGSRAEKLKPFLTKGKKAVIQGRLDYSQYQAKDGSKRSSVGIIVEEIEFFSDGKDAAVKAVESGFGAYAEEEIPF